MTIFEECCLWPRFLAYSSYLYIIIYKRIFQANRAAYAINYHVITNGFLTNAPFAEVFCRMGRRTYVCSRWDKGPAKGTVKRKLPVNVSDMVVEILKGNIISKVYENWLFSIYCYFTTLLAEYGNLDNKICYNVLNGKVIRFQRLITVVFWDQILKIELNSKQPYW